MTITNQTRRESWKTVKPTIKTRQDAVLETLTRLTCFPEPLAVTAEKIADQMGVNIYTIRPRLTELMQAGKVKAISKIQSPVTGKRIARYQVAE